MGFAAAGVVYVIAGILAMIITLRSFGWSTVNEDEASPLGALKTVSDGPGGSVLLWILALGLLLYAAWRLVSAVMPGEPAAMTMIKRIGFVITAAIYIALAITAVSLSRSHATSTDSNTRVTTLSGRIMSHAAGQFVVGVFGLIVIAVGLYSLRSAAKRDVTDELDLSGMSQHNRRLTKTLGVVGELGRGTATGLVGLFLLRAAITYTVSDATGLDGALRRVALQPWGRLVVAIVAIGFVAYGVFCLKTFPHRRLQAPRT
ncbi:MAG: DUF1206 domain-containing protein [Acidimicrobiales bacterium]